MCIAAVETWSRRAVKPSNHRDFEQANRRVVKVWNRGSVEPSKQRAIGPSKYQKTILKSVLICFTFHTHMRNTSYYARVSWRFPADCVARVWLNEFAIRRNTSGSDQTGKSFLLMANSLNQTQEKKNAGNRQEPKVCKRSGARNAHTHTIC